MINKLLHLSRFNKQLFFLLVDIIALFAVLLAAFSLRLGYWFWPDKDLLWLLLLTPVFAIPFFYHFGLYRSVIRYIGLEAIWTIVQAVSIYALVWGTFIFMVSAEGIPRSVILINWLFAIVAISGIRMFVRWFLRSLNLSEATNVIVYGAGSAGRQLSIALNTSNEYNPIAFIDDDIDMQGSYIGGLKVISLNEFVNIYNRKNVTEVIVAMPSISGSKRTKIIGALEPYAVHVRSLPGIS